MSKLTDLINIGPVSTHQLEQIGINNTEEFMRQDPYTTFNQLLTKVDPTLCRSALAGIVGAHKGVKWNLVSKEAAAEYLKRYPEHQWPS